MIVTNQIKGRGNLYQQDRTGNSAQITSDGTPTRLIWVLDGHGKDCGYTRVDLGGAMAQKAHTILSDLSGDDIYKLHSDTTFGKELFAHIETEITEIKHTILKQQGWNHVKDKTGMVIPVLWTKSGYITTPSGGTTLIMVAMIKDGDDWVGRMYNVGDSMMVFKDTVYSQCGLEGLTDDTVKSICSGKTKTIYESPQKTSYVDNDFHKISPTGEVSTKSPPYQLHNPLFFHSSVRGDIALAIKYTFTPAMFELGVVYPGFGRLTSRLACWSNMGDTQTPNWAPVPSYSKTFLVDGPLSLTSDGIGDILLAEGPTTDEEKIDWFNYYSDHPMHRYSSDKNCIFKNSWFHTTVMEDMSTDSDSASHEDTFYQLATTKFGVADNICRVTFIP